MTTSRQFADSEGAFGLWQVHPRPCPQSSDGRPDGQPCGASVNARRWESSDGAYEDWQYRCAQGHTWWIDGDDG